MNPKPAPQLGYYDGGSFTIGIPHLLPHWIRNSNEADRALDLARSGTIGSIPLEAFFVRFTDDLGQPVELPLISAGGTSLVGRVSGDAARMLSIQDLVYDP